jgi:hypothetical protein
MLSFLAVLSHARSTRATASAWVRARSDRSARKRPVRAADQAIGAAVRGHREASRCSSAGCAFAVKRSVRERLDAIALPLGVSAVTVGFRFLIALDERHRPAHRVGAGPDAALVVVRGGVTLPVLLPSSGSGGAAVLGRRKREWRIDLPVSARRSRSLPASRS